MRNIIVEYFVYKILAHENFTYKLFYTFLIIQIRGDK